MEVSAELRWFWDGDVPPEVMEWFIKSPLHPFPAGGEERRNDVYLLDPDKVELGIKARGKRPALQVKGLVARTGHLSEGAFRGEIEIWTNSTESRFGRFAACLDLLTC
jgi:hypothetical protein